MASSLRTTMWIVATFVLLTIVQSWPLPLHLGTHLTSAPSGDTAVYVWNQWVFRHQLVEQGASPLTTTAVLPLTGPADLSLHNYTVFSNLLALPLLDRLGVLQTFNIVYLINAALAGLGLFFLARRLTGRVAESVLAGWMFAWSPFLIARSQGHFSLASAAALPFFLLALDRAWATQRPRDALAVGAVFAWAAFSDPYYAIYCLMLGAMFVAGRMLDVTLVRRPANEARIAKRLIDAVLAVLAVLVVAVHFVGGGELNVGSLRVSMRTLYTPMLIGTLLAVGRIALSTRARVTLASLPPHAQLLRAALVSGIVAVVLLGPMLYGVAGQALDAQGPTLPVLWRSSAPGVDVASVVMPNPHHPLAPSAWLNWLDAHPGGIAENVASVSWVGLWVLAAAWRLARFRPDRFWLLVTAGFGLMALGPFVRVAGANTFLPTPWTLLRYVPIIGDARMPTRFSVVLVLGLCVLTAQALSLLGRRYPGQRRALLLAVGAALFVELLPVPRTLHPAPVPAIYQQVAADPRPVRVLQLPTGVRDGLSSIGDFEPVAQYYQTFHGKGLVGGYLSRVPPRSQAALRGFPVMHALLTLSEKQRLSPLDRARAHERAADFLTLTNLGYVVMDHTRTTDDLREFATDLLGLTIVRSADGYDLYVPRVVRQD